MATETKTIEFLGTGRRKTAVARVRLASGTGKITVNGRAVRQLFPARNPAVAGVPAADRHRHGGKIRRAHQRHRRRTERPGRRGAARHCPRAAASRRDTAALAEGRGPADPRSAHERAQKIRPAGRAQTFPILRNVNRTGNFQAPLVQSGGVFYLQNFLCVSVSLRDRKN